jgi:nucleotide-binding universal stress UspA family protein
MVLEGPPIAGRILDAVEKVRPDVLVIGIHERRGLRRFLVGSVADKVIRHCPVSLFVVRPPAVEPRIRLVDDEHQGG